MTAAILKSLGSLVQYTPLPKQRSELYEADGETVLFKLVELNKDFPIEFDYMVGSDHRHWEVSKGGRMLPDEPPLEPDTLHHQLGGNGLRVPASHSELLRGIHPQLRVQSSL
jgi:hypothetical protein